MEDLNKDLEKNKQYEISEIKNQYILVKKEKKSLKQIIKENEFETKLLNNKIKDISKDLLEKELKMKIINEE